MCTDKLSQCAKQRHIYAGINMKRLKKISAAARSFMDLEAADEDDGLQDGVRLSDA